MAKFYPINGTWTGIQLCMMDAEWKPQSAAKSASLKSLIFKVGSEIDFESNSCFIANENYQEN